MGFLYNFTVSKTVLNSDDNFHFSCPFSCLTKSYDFLIDASVKLAEGWRPLFFRHKLRGTQKYLQVCKGYRETLYHLTDAVCEPDILKENFKLLEHKHFLVLKKNLYGSNQTLQAEVNGFKEGRMRERNASLTTTKKVNTPPLRQQLGPSSKIGAPPSSAGGALSTSVRSSQDPGNLNQSFQK